MRRKILIITLSLIAFLGISYMVMAPHLPELTVKILLNRLDGPLYGIISESTELEIDEEKEALLNKFLTSVSYEIKDSRIEGTEAYVTVNLTLIDISQLVSDNRQKLIMSAIGNFGGDLNSGMESIMVQALLTLLEDETLEPPLITKDIEFLLERSGLLWIPVIDEDWRESIFELNDLGILMR